MYREVFSNLARDLTRLNPEELVIVTYNRKEHEMTLHQIGTQVMLGYLRPFTLPPKNNFKIGILNSSGLARLKSELNKLLTNNLLDEESLVPDLGRLKLDWYRCFRNLPDKSPQKVITLNFVNVKSRFWTWFTCMYASNQSKILYKSIKRGNKKED